MSAGFIICLAILAIVLIAGAIAWRLAGAVVRDRDEVTNQRKATNAISLAGSWQKVQNDELTLKMREQSLALGQGTPETPKADAPTQEALRARIEQEAERIARQKLREFERRQGDWRYEPDEAQR